MRRNLGKILLACAFSTLLMAFQCEEDLMEGPFAYNPTKVRISPGPQLRIGDTLWISGQVSSLIFDEGLQDSVMNPDASVSDVISVLRLSSQSGQINTLEAIGEFGMVARRESIDFLEACPESDLIAIAPKTESGQDFSYEIGLIPNNSGDFVLSWMGPVEIQNQDLNVQLLSAYPLDRESDAIGLTRCGITSTRLEVSESRREFFFSVD